MEDNVIFKYTADGEIETFSTDDFQVEDDIDVSIDEDVENQRKAFEAVCKYLANAPHTFKECKDKLYEKGFHRGAVEYALEKAKRYRYIDDEEYVRMYLLSNQKRYGAKKIAYKLTVEKGIDKNTVSNIIADNMDKDVEFETAMSIAQKYAKQKRIVDRTGSQKVGAYLYQKGFEWGIINKVLDKLFVDFDFD